MSFPESTLVELQHPESEIENHQDLEAAICCPQQRKPHSSPQDIEHRTTRTFQAQLLVSLQFQRS